MEEWKFRGKPGLVIVHMQEGIVGSLLSEERARDVRESDHIPVNRHCSEPFARKTFR